MNWRSIAVLVCETFLLGLGCPKLRWAIQRGEGTADSGMDDKELKVLTNWRRHDDVVITILAVEPQQVVLGKTEAADRCFGLQTGMRAMPIVTMQPVA